MRGCRARCRRAPRGCVSLDSGQYQPDATFTGGIAETWRIIRKVQAAGARYTPHTWTNGIGFAINLMLQGASPFREETLLEYPLDPPGWVPSARDGILESHWIHEKGTLRLPDEPGLGFRIDKRALRRWGRRFYRGTKLRVAVTAIREKGLRTAKAAGTARDARLLARDAELERKIAAGEDPALAAASA